MIKIQALITFHPGNPILYRGRLAAIILLLFAPLPATVNAGNTVSPMASIFRHKMTQ